MIMWWDLKLISNQFWVMNSNALKKHDAWWCFIYDESPLSPLVRQCYSPLRERERKKEEGKYKSGTQYYRWLTENRSVTCKLVLGIFLYFSFYINISLWIKAKSCKLLKGEVQFNINIWIGFCIVKIAYMYIKLGYFKINKKY